MIPNNKLREYAKSVVNLSKDDKLERDNKLLAWIVSSLIDEAKVMQALTEVVDDGDDVDGIVG